MGCVVIQLYLWGVDMETKDIISLSSDLQYLKDEFEVHNQLWACRDGYVELDKLIKYCSENDHLLHHIIAVAKKVNSIKK